MARPPRRPPRRSLWTRIKHLLGFGGPPPPPPDPPDEEPALVPVGPPRSPRPADAVALDPPDEPDDVDARGRTDG